MNENNKIAVPALSVTLTHKKLPIHKKAAGIAALILAALVSGIGLCSPSMSVTMFYTPGVISRWTEVLICFLLVCVLLFSVVFLVCELAGYTKPGLFASAALSSVLLWVLFSCRSYYASMDSSVSLTGWLLNNLPFYLTAFAAVFLFGKFVLFRKPRDEQAKK